jgi:hypothetical protein
MGGNRRQCTAVPVGGGHWSSCSGETVVRSGQQAARGGSVHVYQAVGSLRWSECGSGGEAQRAASNGDPRQSKAKAACKRVRISGCFVGAMDGFPRGHDLS